MSFLLLPPFPGLSCHLLSHNNSNSPCMFFFNPTITLFCIKRLTTPLGGKKTEKRLALLSISNFSVWKMDKFDFDKYDLISVKEI